MLPVPHYLHYKVLPKAEEPPAWGTIQKMPLNDRYPLPVVAVLC